MSRSSKLHRPRSLRRRAERAGAAILTPGEFFDGRAVTYDDAYDDPSTGGHTLRARMAATLELVGPGPGTALDVGMGPGRLCGELVRRGFTVSGVDSSDAMVERARARLATASRLLRAEMTALPFPDASFDVVTSTGVMEYVHDRRAGLEEIARVLRPGGRAVISIPNPVALYARSYRPHVRAVAAARQLVLGCAPARPAQTEMISRRDFESLLADAKLHIVAVRYAGFLLIPLPLDAAIPRLAGRLAARVEPRLSALRNQRRGPNLGAMLATQVVCAARR